MTILVALRFRERRASVTQMGEGLFHARLISRTDCKFMAAIAAMSTKLVFNVVITFVYRGGRHGVKWEQSQGTKSRRLRRLE